MEARYFDDDDHHWRRDVFWSGTLTSRQLARSAIWMAMTIVGLLLAFAIAYFLRGSLEEFPTAEDEAKVRTVTGVLAAILAIVEIGLWSLLRAYATRTAETSTRTAPRP